MKITLVTTVKNEEKTIKRFLDSIVQQTKKPDEVVVVDGGSTDKTFLVISNYKFLISKNNVKIFRKKGNRSIGRNTAVKSSAHEIVACADAGCILEKNWLERITKPFEKKNVDVAAGFYKPKASSIFEKCLATYTCVMEDRLDVQNYLPSSRSVAFRKSAWKKVGGYPENLDTCEDLVFAKRMKQKGLQFITVKNAIVYWPQRKNILQAAKQFFAYAKGDGQAHYFRKSTPFLFGRYLAGVIFLIYITTSKNYDLLIVIYFMLFVYILWSIRKNYKYVKNYQAFFYLPLLQIVSDIAVISGTIIGLGESLWDTQNK